MSGQHDSRPAAPGANQSAGRRAGVILAMLSVAALVSAPDARSPRPSSRTAATHW